MEIMSDEIPRLKVNIQEVASAPEEIDLRAIYEHVQNENPKSRKGKRVKKFALNEQQRTELLEILKNNSNSYKIYIMALLQLTTGMREGEIVNLTHQQINFKSQFIQIEPRKCSKYSKAWKPKTESSIRQIYVPTNTNDTLKAYCSSTGRTTGYVFLSRKHCAYDIRSYNRALNTAARKCKSLGFNIGTHSLRRTFISYNLAQKTDTGFIQKSVGHSTMKTTMIYAQQIQDFENIKEFNKTMNSMVKIKKGEN